MKYHPTPFRMAITKKLHTIIAGEGVEERQASCTVGESVNSYSHYREQYHMYGCESGTVKKAEHRRIDAFELWYWRRLLRVPRTARSNQPMLNMHWKDWCWSWSSNSLATCYEELTHWKRPWCWEILKIGKQGNDRGWDSSMTSPTQWTWVWASSGRWWRTEKPGMLQSMGSQRVRHDWVPEKQPENSWSMNPTLEQIPKQAIIPKDTWTPKFSAAALIFIITRTWKQPRCLSTEE